MGDSKDSDVDMGTVAECGTTGAELEAGETLAESMVCEEGQVVAVEGGSLHGEDVMVEVLGSEVFVDGVCTSSGDGIGESAGDEGAGHGGGGELGEVVQEEEVESLGREKLGLREVVDSAGEVRKGWTETESVELSGKGDGVSAELEAKVSEEGAERGVEDPSVAADCASGETQVVAIEEDTGVGREEGLTQELVEEGEERDESKEDGVLATDAQNPIEESSVESSPKAEGSAVGETRVVVDTFSSTIVETVSHTTVGVKQDGKPEEGSGAKNDLEEQKVGVPDDAVVRDPEIETTVVCSSTFVESVNIHTQSFPITSDIASGELGSLDMQTQPAVGEEVASKGNEMSASSKAEGMETDECSVHEQQVNVHVVGEGTEDHNNAPADPVLSNEPTEVIEGADPFVLSDSIKSIQSKVDENMDDGLVHDLKQIQSSVTDKMEVDPQSTDGKQIGVHEVESEQLELTAETGSKDNEIEAVVTGRMGEDASKSNEDSANSKPDDLVSKKNDRQLKSEESIDRGSGSDFAELNSHAGNNMDVQEEANDAEEVKEQPGNGGNENNTEALADPTLCQPSQVTIEGDVLAMDIDVLPNQNLEIQDSVGLDGLLPCSESNQNVKVETVWQSTEIDNQSTSRMEMATMSNEAMNVDVESKGPGEKGQQLKLDCLDSNANYGLSEIDSRLMQEMEIENQVTDAKDGVFDHSNLVVEHADHKISELMGEFPDGDSGPEEKVSSKLVLPTDAKKHNTFDSPLDDSVIQDGTKTMSSAKVTNTAISPKQSFKIGECIQRAANQLTGPPSILKCNNDKHSGDSFGVSLEDLEDTQTILLTECSSLDELLSQLHLAAQDPFQNYNFSNSIVSFFSDFRDSIVPSQTSVMEKFGKRKMPPHSAAGYPETFEFVDMNDSYWTDMVVQNGSLEQLSRKSRKGEYQVVPVALEPDKGVQASRRPYSRKRYREANDELTVEKQVQIDEKRRASPAEIIMTFSMVNSVPSEMKLNKMFKRFGPLKESETEVDWETCRARVVYKKGSDAEVAYSSAGKFNIFGPVVVNYQLNFYPFEPFKALYIPSIEGLEEATLYLHSQELLHSGEKVEKGIEDC